MTKLFGQFSIERVHKSCTLVIPDCDRIGPDERMAFGFHNLSRSYDALGHCVTLWGYDNVVKGTTNIGVGQTGGRSMRLIEADERQAFLATLN
jgi:hypothetical protein